MVDGADPRSDPESCIASAAADMGLELSAEAVGRLQRYLDLHQRWNAVYNLTAVRDPAAMRVQHVFDSLAVVGPLVRVTAALTLPRVLDVGSGAGVPGVILAIADTRFRVTCVDTVGKKAAFVSQVAG